MSMNGNVLIKMLKKSFDNYGLGAFLITTGLHITFEVNNGKQNLVKVKLLRNDEEIQEKKQYKVIQFCEFFILFSR